MNAASQFSLTELAVNPASVTPAANGCFENGQSHESLLSGNSLPNTHAGNAQFIFIADMYVLHRHLNIVDDLGDQRLH